MILVATDGSKDSELSIRRAVDLATETDAALHLSYVMILSHWMVPDTLSDAQYERLKNDARKLLDQQVEKANVAGANMDAVQGHLRIGRRADEEIIKLAGEIEADMIAVGSRGAVRSAGRSWVTTRRASSATPTDRCWSCGARKTADNRTAPP